MGEIYDESLSVDHWSDRKAKKVLLGEIRLGKDEIVSEKPLDEWETSREEFEGYTGNAGMAGQFVKALEVFDDQPTAHNWRIREVDRSKLLVSLVGAMLGAGAQKPLLRLIDHALSCEDKYELTEAHLAAIFALESRLAKLPEPNRAISHWLTECRTVLETRTAQAPQKPADYRRPHKLSCDCSLCRELSNFLADPDQQQHRFSVRKALRRHLHDAINGNHCDLTHVTDRRGSPQTLVCTKTTASYDKACQIHNRDLKNLARIVTLGKKAGSW